MTLAEVMEREWHRGRDAGIEQGLEQGLEKGISSLVKGCLRLGVSKEQIIESLIQDFNLDETAAIDYFQQFSERN